MWVPTDERTLAAIKELETASDRAAAIVIGTLVESTLTEALRTLLRRDTSDYLRKIHAQMFGPDGPLGTFGAKIGLGYLLAMFTEKAHADLQNIKNIRNVFAHYAEHSSFGSQKLTDMCANLTLPDTNVMGPVTYRPQGDVTRAAVIDAIFYDEQGRTHLCLKEHEAAKQTPRGRFTCTAQLFCAVFTAFQDAMKDNKQVFLPLL